MKRKKRPEMAGVLTGQSPGSSNIGTMPDLNIRIISHTMAGVLTGQSPGSSNIGRRPVKQRHRKEE